MRPDDWHLTDDVEDFLTRAGGFLRSRPALHNTALTDIETLRRPGAGTSVLGRLEADGEVRAVCYLTPRGRLGLTPLSAERADVLAARLAGLGHSPAQVVADHDTAGAFAASWQWHSGAAPTPFWRTHLYRLGTLTPPQPLPRGRGRRAGAGDHEHVVRWCREFCVEVGERPSIELIDAGRWDASRFGDRHFTFWETPDGTPVSLAAVTPVVGGMVRVDPVYTPARHRGRGYAGAVTVEVSRAALSAGATDVVLFADPANPTSNALYRRIGYVHLADFAGHRFAYGGPDAGRGRTP
ncbi:GNAT family N-acetyltransferase [Streptomyces sp. RO-S4]|uniref:GNAT family N-acetyltransferase n=1 Tax=unclassified Streptomyces TaxID=2593676 RepID=UPI00208E3B16|nr:MULTISPECIES: GNAT family N-acetyltransferase [unclassified Streptomyces]MCO4695808.1 GNAT family N-acetyltransferase [Streptomyces sp. RO-S4]MDU0300520.1 GNAT family N-acetyltransferase [Streptomyces sp. PAL114]